MNRLLPWSLLLCALLLGPSLCRGDEPKTKPTPKPKLSAVLAKSFELRSEGKLAAAALGLEEVLSRLKETSEHRRVVALELAQLYVVMKRPRRAVEVYRRIKDLPREVVTLLAMEDARSHREALVVSRSASYSLGEALALAKLGKNEEALAVFEKAGPGLARERGKLLLSLRRYKEAAAAFELAKDYLGQGRATWTLDRTKAKRLFEDAAASLQLTYTELRPGLGAAKARFKQAAPGTDKTRQRIFYAQCLGRLGQLRRELSECFARTGDRARAHKQAKAALRALKSQRLHLTNRGQDSFGAAAAEALGVDRAIAEAEAELEGRKAPPE